MRILHIVPHLGGGIGTVIEGWVKKDIQNHHSVVLLEIPERNPTIDYFNHVSSFGDVYHFTPDIVIVHYWNRLSLQELLSQPLPPCRLVFWAHKNIPYTQKELDYPDLFIDTSPIQKHGRYIWSTGNMERFQKIEPVPHEGINIGFIGHRRKAHPQLEEAQQAIALKIPSVQFINLGEDWLKGKVEDIVPYLVTMDIFLYLLRRGNYATAEQIIGEVMSAKIATVVLNNPAEKHIVQGHGIVATTIERAIEETLLLCKDKIYRKDIAIKCNERAQIF